MLIFIYQNLYTVLKKLHIHTDLSTAETKKQKKKKKKHEKMDLGPTSTIVNFETDLDHCLTVWILKC